MRVWVASHSEMMEVAHGQAQDAALVAAFGATRRDSPERVRKVLVNTARRPPVFSYAPLHVAIREMLVLRVPYDQIIEYVRRAEKRPEYARTLLEILPLIRRHLEGVSPDFFQDVAPRTYSFAPDIVIPFQPPIIYGIGGQLYLPWFIFWRRNPLSGKPLSLFTTLVDEILMEDADLETAIFQLLDFSIPKGEVDRQLLVKDASEIPRLSNAERDEMLAIWAESYRQARTEMAGATPEMERHKDDTPRADDGQGDLFGGER